MWAALWHGPKDGELMQLSVETQVDTQPPHHICVMDTETRPNPTPWKPSAIGLYRCMGRWGKHDIYVYEWVGWTG